MLQYRVWVYIEKPRNTVFSSYKFEVKNRACRKLFVIENVNLKKYNNAHEKIVKNLGSRVLRTKNILIENLPEKMNGISITVNPQYSFAKNE